MLGGCPGAIPVARAVEMAWTPQLSGVTWQLTAHQLPGGGGPGDKGRSGEAGLHPPAPTPRPLPTSTASLTTLPRILGPSPTPVPLLPETPHPPTPSHTFLSWDSSSPSVCPLSPLPSSPALIALPVSCCPPALHLCLSEPQVINFLSPGLASSHLYPVRTHWKDRLSPRPCFPQEPRTNHTHTHTHRGIAELGPGEALSKNP